ncbi:uncharacterized protein LOC130766915 [Actinidia eriantha]|uniref:uncharacterized protein LOC130766915 n=1 Tax=Actinidia eriantha TaxID=165200 RepID=UPI002586FE03|nr:uncharacterized protein LOC130766915 [Actinidia eriantha]
MDNSGLGGGFLSSPRCGFLDLESPIQRYQQTKMGHQPHNHHRHMKSPTNIMVGIENDHPIGLVGAKGAAQKGFPMNFGKGKAVASVKIGNSNHTNSSEEDEPIYDEDVNCEDVTAVNRGKGKKESPWQRMKWTDNIVRLLIAVVARVGDDGTLEDAEGMKRKSGVLQKKGKWKTVSKVMISKGCYISPQQCEDKFNDLNKRYKKLNDILGRGTSCRVVEDPSLMESMPQLSAKLKEDVRKILSSKHLFYKEMCAYHNGKKIPNCDDIDLQAHSFPLMRCSKDNNGSEEEETEENGESDDDESDNEDNNNTGGNMEQMEEHGEQKKQDEEDGSFWFQSSVLGRLEAEMADIFQDPTRSLWEQRVWITEQMLQLQEQRVSIQAEAFESEKRRFKWLRFRSKKERELERSRLENERRMFDNERMALQLKQKELEIGLKRPDVSLDADSLNISRWQGKDQIDLGRHQ